MNNIYKKCSFIILIILFSSCGGDKFSRVEVLDSFRVLAIISDKPEVSVSGNLDIVINPLIADPGGEARVIEGRWQACVDPGVNFGATPNCEHDPLSVSSDYTIDTNISDFTDFNSIALGPSVNLSVPLYLHQNRSARDIFNGVSYIIIFQFEVDEKVITAFRRVNLTTRTEINENPTITNVFLNNEALNKHPLKDDRLSIELSNPENYEFLDQKDQKLVQQEQFLVSWFMTSGTLTLPKTKPDEESKFKLSADSSKDYILIGILRDNRNGVSYTRQKVSAL